LVDYNYNNLRRGVSIYESLMAGCYLGPTLLGLEPHKS